MEQFNTTVKEALRHYVADSPREWDLHVGNLTSAYSTQIHCANRFAPFELTQSNPPQPLAVKPTAQDRQATTAASYRHRWQKNAYTVDAGSRQEDGEETTKI